MAPDLEPRRFVLDPFEPAYLSLAPSELSDRAATALQELEDCCICPRNCHIDRIAGQTKVCRTGRHARVASAAAHFGEEDCLRGWNGSGTIFLSCCNLRCVFCQNWDLSQHEFGPELTADEIASLMLSLQDRNCHNINFVTPEHVVPQIVEAIVVAAKKGLRLPIVYNTSAYDSITSLHLLDGLVDIYMPDFKFWRPETATRLAKARDYPARAREAIAEMHQQVGPLQFGPERIARRGVLVRHLVMPGQTDETRAIMHWLATQISKDTYVNIMAQYRPSYLVNGSRGRRYHDINRRPTNDELQQARAAARASGLWRLDGPSSSDGAAA